VINVTKQTLVKHHQEAKTILSQISNVGKKLSSHVLHFSPTKGSELLHM